MLQTLENQTHLNSFDLIRNFINLDRFRKHECKLHLYKTLRLFGQAII